MYTTEALQNKKSEFACCPRTNWEYRLAWKLVPPQIRHVWVRAEGAILSSPFARQVDQFVG
jgi:hypothetical protein